MASATAHGAAEQGAGEESRREERREELDAIKGAQHVGTVRGLGATNGSKERGKRRWLASCILTAPASGAFFSVPSILDKFEGVIFLDCSIILTCL